MNRKKTNLGGFESLISTSKELFNNRLAAIPNGAILSAARFRGKLGSAIAVITSLIVGFLTIPNNILYFIDNKHGTRNGHEQPDAESASPPPGRPAFEYAYIHAGIALVTLGCLAMVVSVVLSYFAAKSKWKMDDSGGPLYASPESVKSTRTVLTCLIMMNIELFMAVIAGCMELLYRPLIADSQRLHNVECAIAVFNIVIYIMYVVTMVMTSTVLKGKRERMTNPVDVHRDIADAMTVPSSSSSARDYISRSVNPYNSQSSFM